VYIFLRKYEHQTLLSSAPTDENKENKADVKYLIFTFKSRNMYKISYLPNGISTDLTSEICERYPLLVSNMTAKE
jgi:hypothetical protein